MPRPFHMMILMLAVALAGCGARQQPAAPSPSAAPQARTVTVRPTATAVPSPLAPTPPPPTAVPPTAVPPTAVPPTAVPPTAVPPTAVPPTAVPAPPGTEAPSAPPEAGMYVFPVQPAAGVQYGPCHHDYPASDMFTPIGSQFVAVTSGVIDWVTRTDTWDPAINDPTTRGGLSVALVGDDGVRYYGSHLSQVADGIAPGVLVAAGTLLGLTGKSGDAVNTPAHLHFGLSHPTSPDDWETRRGQINPYPYLNAWRTGEQRRPNLDVVGGGAC